MADLNERVRNLKSMPLLAGLPHSEQEAMAERVTERSYEIGDELIKEGTSGDSAFLIVEGKCEVRRSSGKRSTRMAYLGAGDFFGELSILAPAPRTATVSAIEPTKVFIVSGYEFEKALKQNKSMALHMARVLAARLRNLQDEFAPALRR